MVWTQPEIDVYEPRDYAPLRNLYKTESIAHSDPEKRAQYLSEKVLNLTQTDHEVVMRTAHEKGRVAALNLLEDMVISEHQHRLNVLRETIPVPLEHSTPKYSVLEDSLESRRFDRELFNDLGIGFGIFGITLIPCAMKVPVLGSPFMLLIGPYVGVCLSLYHRSLRR